MKFTETLLHKFDVVEVSQLIFSEGSPFDDNGGDTDGPSYLLEAVTLREGGYDVIVPETIAPRQDIKGYRLDGYKSSMSEYFKRNKINTWMGNDSQQMALFVAADYKVDKLIEDLEDLQTKEETKDFLEKQYDSVVLRYEKLTCNRIRHGINYNSYWRVSYTSFQNVF